MIDFTKLLLKHYNVTLEEFESALYHTDDEEEQQDNEEDK